MKILKKQGLAALLTLPLLASTAFANEEKPVIKYLQYSFTIKTAIKNKHVKFERDRGPLLEDNLSIKEKGNQIEISDVKIDGIIDKIKVNDLTFRRDFEKGFATYEFKIKGLYSEAEMQKLFKDATTKFEHYKKVLEVDKVEQKAKYMGLMETADKLLE